MEMEVRLAAILRALKITEIEYSLDGGGDSGETTLERVVRRDGETTTTLPDVPIIFSDGGQILYLPYLLERIVADAPDGDWVNNEGGYGTVYVRPFDEDGGLGIECDMSYREYDDDADDDDGGFVDDEDPDEDSEPNDDTVSSLPIIEVGEFAS